MREEVPFQGLHRCINKSKNVMNLIAIQSVSSDIRECVLAPNREQFLRQPKTGKVQFITIS